MANTTHYGSIKTGSPGAAQQAASIGATIGNDGYWYKNGQKLTPQQADALTQQAGTAVNTTDDAHGAPSHGWVEDTYGRNSSWLDPVLSGAATLINPALGAAVSGGLNYGHNHNLGSAALSAGAAYGGGKLLSGLGKAAGGLPGVSAITDAARGVENAVPGLSGAADAIGGAGKAVGNWWDQNVKQPMQAGADASGFKLPGLSDIGKFATGNGGLNALGIAQGLNAANLMNTSQGYAKQAANLGLQNWSANQGIRDAGRAGILNPQTPNTSFLSTTRGRNPFAVAPVGA